MKHVASMLFELETDVASEAVSAENSSAMASIAARIAGLVHQASASVSQVRGQRSGGGSRAQAVAQQEGTCRSSARSRGPADPSEPALHLYYKQNSP